MENKQYNMISFLKWILIIGSIICIALLSVNMYMVFSFAQYKDSPIVDQYLTENSETPQIDVVKAMAKLDEYALQRRHHFARVSMFSSISIKFMGFIIGFIICVFGAIFVLGKINLANDSKIELGEENIGKVSIQSTSPGLIMIVLGIVLIAFISKLKHSTSISDSSNYLPDIETSFVDSSDFNTSFIDSSISPIDSSHKLTRRDYE